MRVWMQAKRLMGAYRHFSHYVQEARFIEEAVGYLSQEDRDRLLVKGAREALPKLNIQLETKGVIEDRPCLLVGSHLSYLDRLILMAQKRVHVLCEQKFRRVPSLGEVASLADSIFFEQNEDGRLGAFQQAAGHIMSKGHTVAALLGDPSFTKPWQPALFEIAAEHGILLQPFRIHYQPFEKANYRGKDFLPQHVWRLFDGLPLKAEIEFHEAVAPVRGEQGARRWQEWCEVGRGNRTPTLASSLEATGVLEG